MALMEQTARNHPIKQEKSDPPPPLGRRGCFRFSNSHIGRYVREGDQKLTTSFLAFSQGVQLMTFMTRPSP